MVELVPCADSHIWLLHGWRNEPDVADKMFQDRPVSREAHEAWYQRLLDQADRAGWVISHQGRFVGATFLTGIDPDNSRADFGIYLADASARGKGVGAAAQFLVIEEALVRRELHKLCAQVLSHNESGLAMYDRYGFVHEGVLREHFRRGSRFLDVHHFGLFRSTWVELRHAARRELSEKGLLPCEN